MHTVNPLLIPLGGVGGGGGLTSSKITNDVGKLTANEIRTNMENCLVNLKHRCPNGTIAISGLTYVPRDNSKSQLIDEINCHYESICTDLGVTLIDNKIVTCDDYGNLIDSSFFGVRYRAVLSEGRLT